MDMDVIRAEKILKTDEYDLQLCSDKGCLTIRLTIKLSSSKAEIYQSRLKSVIDIPNLKGVFDNLEQLKQYMKNIENIEVIMDSKSILLTETWKLKNKKIQIACIPLEFIKITNKSKSQILAYNILQLCDTKKRLTESQVRVILESIAIYLSEQSKQNNQIKQKFQLTEQRMESFERSLATHKNTLEQQMIYLRQYKNNGVQQSLQINEKIHDIITKYNEIQKRISLLTSIIQQSQNNSRTSSPNHKKQLRQNIYENNRQLFLQMEEIQKIKINLTAMENLNAKKLMPDVVKALKCQNRLNQYIQKFENKKQLKIYLQQGVNSLPEIIGDLVSLQHLSIFNSNQNSQQKLLKLPESLIRMKSLKKLSYYKSISEINQEEIQKLKKLPMLEQLSINKCSINKLPKIEQLQQLRQLTIVETQIYQFPDVFRLPYLKIVNVSYNKITKISNEISKMKNLQQLNVSGNPLTLSTVQQLTKNMIPLKRLRKLFLRDLRLSQANLGVYQLTQLQFLDLSQNYLTKLPAQIQNLQNLYQLVLDGCCNLSQLSKKIVHLKKLNVLHISGCKLTKLPFELFELIQLMHINLGCNKIEQIPSQIGNLTKLNYLNICGNKLIKVPKSLNCLSKQCLINLSGNQLDGAAKQMLQQMKKAGFKQLYM